ncbi:PDZ domain-containing protein [Psychrobium sp. MM17-31]|uniref:PDZ domain-containing protein n=1 Tax=Psychrobium sp. MM17-31 TaxID=2917758 RepID=UPI001EF6295F|nr:PDZ domain-containing protein [Psychrobium sp. MM17-31]MCG7533323.1 PDZ domain-containing protein [Psychrobium sp. MM17-31]
MKYANQLLLIGLFGVGTNQAIASQSCSSMTISDTANNAVFELVGHNMNRVSERRRMSERLLDEQSFTLEPGNHTMTFYRWDKSKLRGVLRNPQFYSGIKAEPVTISVNVEANKHYQLINSLKDNKSVLEVVSVTNKICDNDKKLKAQANGGIAKVILPELIQYRLDLLMEEINRTGGSKPNVIPTNVVSYFGAIVKPATNNKMVILAVSPYSLADKMGLKTGDNITHLGGNSITSLSNESNSPLTDYLEQLRDGAIMEVTVERSGEQLVMSKRFDVKVVPEIQYSFATNELKRPALVNSSSLLPELDRKLDKLLIEISDLPELKHRENLKQLRIERAKSYDKKYGITGEMAQTRDGFIVHRVKANSAADNVGIRADDVIVDFNGADLNGLSIAEVSGIISDVNVGEKYSLTVSRNGQLIDLSGTLNPLELPAYQLAINTDSISKAKNILANVTKIVPVRRIDRVQSGEIIGFYFDPWATNLSRLSNRDGDLTGRRALNSKNASNTASSSRSSSNTSSGSSNSKPSGASNTNN